MTVSGGRPSEDRQRAEGGFRSAPESREICACGPDGHALCDCGHTDYWHSFNGEGDCEHDGECSCVAFAPWTNVEHFSDCDGEWPCSCIHTADVGGLLNPDVAALQEGQK